MPLSSRPWCAGVCPPLFGVSKAGCGEWRSSVKLVSSTERKGELFIFAVSSQCDINNGFPRLKTGKDAVVNISLEFYPNIIYILLRLSRSCRELASRLIGLIDFPACMTGGGRAAAKLNKHIANWRDLMYFGYIDICAFPFWTVIVYSFRASLENEGRPL